MKSKVHVKMTPEERAKQFMPFAALKGYEEALRAKEKEIEEANTHKVDLNSFGDMPNSFLNDLKNTE